MPVFSLSARKLKFLLNCWPPLWGAGIRVDTISEDYMTARAHMKLRWYNRNFVGTHYGGSLYSMSDPFYMLMLLHLLGPEYYVWDIGGKIDYLKPGKDKVIAEFKLTTEILERIKAKTQSGKKYVEAFPVDIVDTSGTIIAKIERQLYFKLKSIA